METQHHIGLAQNGRNGNGSACLTADVTAEAAYGYPRDFAQNRFVYLVISPRAKGLSIGVNMNPLVKCNFHCVYCEIDRTQPARGVNLDVDRMADELRATLETVRVGEFRRWPKYARLPEDLLQLRHVALSGDGEPTLSSSFVEAIQAVAHVRAMNGFFKMVLLTNSTSVDRPDAQIGLKYLTREDEIWMKLDGGTQEYLEQVNGSTMSLVKILDNILLVGRRRPVVIQSLFPAINGRPPTDEDVEEYAQRLKELKNAGAEISLVQIYSATRPMARGGCTHLQLKELSAIARTVRKVTGLRAEVY